MTSTNDSNNEAAVVGGQQATAGGGGAAGAGRRTGAGAGRTGGGAITASISSIVATTSTSSNTADAAAAGCGTRTRRKSSCVIPLLVLLATTLLLSISFVFLGSNKSSKMLDVTKQHQEFSTSRPEQSAFAGDGISLSRKSKSDLLISGLSSAAAKQSQEKDEGKMNDIVVVLEEKGGKKSSASASIITGGGTKGIHVSPLLSPVGGAGEQTVSSGGGAAGNDDSSSGILLRNRNEQQDDATGSGKEIEENKDDDDDEMEDRSSVKEEDDHENHDSSSVDRTKVTNNNDEGEEIISIPIVSSSSVGVQTKTSPGGKENVIVNDDGEIITIPIVSSSTTSSWNNDGTTASARRKGKASSCVSSLDCSELDYVCVLPPSNNAMQLLSSKNRSRRQQETCNDDSSFEFTLDNGNTADCEWLTFKNADTRTAKYCPRGNVKGACQSTCNFCPCTDQVGFTFSLFFNPSIIQGCDWLTKNNVDFRIGRYCYDDNGKTSDIGNACVDSCGFCSSGSPTAPSPTTPSSTPAPKLIGCPDGCSDDPNYVLILMYNSEERDCDWISKKDVRKDRYCSTINNGFLVSDKCPETCGTRCRKGKEHSEKCESDDECYSKTCGGECRKGKDHSEKCESDDECYSKTCGRRTTKASSQHQQQCMCPTTESCTGCNSKRGAQCLRVENISPKPVDVCSLAATQLQLKSGKSSSSSVSLFDVGGRYSNSYENLDRVISKSSHECFSVLPFQGGTNLLGIVDTKNLVEDGGGYYPPGFVQASMKLTEQEMEDFFGQVSLKGPKRSMKDLLGLQIFINGHWIAHIEEQDVTLPLQGKSTKNYKNDRHRSLLVPTTHVAAGAGEEDSSSHQQQEQSAAVLPAAEDASSTKQRNYNSTISTTRNLKKNIETWEIVKDVYPRVSVSWEDLRSMIRGKVNQKILLVKVHGTKILDFDIPKRMGIEFIGDGLDETTLFILGNMNIYGRASFIDMTISFQDGSLYIDGPTFFKTSRLIDINRCPYGFTEYGGMCFIVSEFIEQADDAMNFCEGFDRSSLSKYSDALHFVLSNQVSLTRNARAWVEPLSSDCSAIGADGSLFETDEQSCDDYIRVLCSASLKEPIYGKTFTSYFTEQIIGTYKQDFFKRIVDKDRLPFQLGGTVSLVQVDLDNQDDKDDDRVGKIFTVPDSRPVAIGLDVTLAYGDQSSLEIAFDTYNDIGMHNYLWPIDNETISLPTKLQLHTNDEVCIKNLDLKVYNETGDSSIVATIPASLFEDCVDYNVCTAADEVSCGRSLMYYDKDLKCTKLAVGSSLVPQDLSIDFMSLRCARLTTWNHHNNMGSPFLVEATLTHANDIVTANELLGDDHHYTFSGHESSFLLDESSVLPTNFELRGAGVLEVFKITRYGKTISSLDFSKMWNCINMCEALGYPTGLLFDAENVTSLQLQLVNAVECRKLELVLTDRGDGREVCTSPSRTVGTKDEILSALEDIESLDNPYRTAMLNVTTNLLGNLTPHPISVPRNRGLILYQDLEVFKDIFAIENTRFIVNSFAELYLNDLLINGTSSLEADDDSEITIAGCDIDIENTARPFLVNAGVSEISSTNIFGKTLLQNIRNGEINHMYVGYYNESSIQNESTNNTIRLSRTTVYEEFTMNRVDWTNFNEDFWGSLVLPDAKRYYESLDEDARCKGVDIPDLVLDDLDENQCREACENEFICSGVITFFLDDTPMCGLCLREEQCSFDCSSFDGGAHYIAGTSFSYTKVKACPYIIRPFRLVQGTTLEECKLFCSYYRPCEGFRVTLNNSCELIADLDFAETCPALDEEFIYIPYVETVKGSFEKVEGGSILSRDHIAKHYGYSLSECATICRKTISCVSFELSADACILYNRRDYKLSGEDKGLFLYVNDVFPKKRYVIYASCYLLDSYQTYNVKTVKRCRDICNDDYSCKGFVFRPLITLSDDNCELFNSTSLVNRVFGPELGCQEQPLRRLPKDDLEDSLLDIPRSNLNQQKVSNDGAHVDRSKSKGGKSSKTALPSQSLQPSTRPSNVPSTRPSMRPSDFPSTSPSDNPSVSILPSIGPSEKPSMSVSPSVTPSVSKEPSATPSLSVRPSQVSETYDLYIAFVEETYTESSGRRFRAMQSFDGMDEEECKTLCFYNKDCIALKFEGDLNTCILGKLEDEVVQSLLVDTNSTYLILDNKQIDNESRYLSTNACFIGEQLEGVDFVVEETTGYFKIPRACTSRNDYFVSAIESPAECGLECSRDGSCLGFMFYVDYSGSKNRDHLGSCTFISSEFDLGTCDGVDNNSDLYLRSDIGGACQASCNIHYLCSSFVFDQGRCDLYSDIALFHYSECDEPQQVHIGLSYRSRDGLVAAPNQCLLEFEDLIEVACYNFTTYEAKNVLVEPIMTPYLCQQHCKASEQEFYAVMDGKVCICGSADMLELPVAENETVRCNIACDGDFSQICGGKTFANVGNTGLPLFGLTLPQCKRECFRSHQCEALVFDDSESKSKCELRSRGEFETCLGSSNAKSIPYIESLEHYYTNPATSFIGTDSILNTTVELKQDCQKLCDAYQACEAIKYDSIANVSNCELLGGDIVRLEEGDIVQGVEVANDVALYTRGFSSDGMTLLTNIKTTFDLDECRTLCDQHVDCGSLVFRSPSCSLYYKNDFVQALPLNMKSLEYESHYISYSYFVDPGQEFHSTNNLCVNDSDGYISKRKTIQSKFDCADYCNSVRECTMFSYNRIATTCILYGVGSTLTTNDCDEDLSTFVMFTRGKFAPKSKACLKDEESLDSIQFNHKNPLECMALCDKWFNCRSFRSDEISGKCTLYESEQYMSSGCSDTMSGLLFVYASEQYFTRLDENFCVGTESITSIDDTPIEACKTICNYHDLCLSFEHTKSGLCVLYGSADFTVCEQEIGKDLYISYKDVVDPETRFFFNELSSCFLVTGGSPIMGVSGTADCKEYCENDDFCAGVQLTGSDCYSISVEKFSDSSILDSDQCDEAFLKTKLNPYKKINNTCLQRPIDFDGAKILNIEVYECMNLCNIHPLCRYFLYGEDAEGGKPVLRECILFEAQGREVDDCDGQYREFIGNFTGLAAYVNGRTFVDQITWFGEPETVFAKLSGISYQECASVCDSIPTCNAFIHTWNYRRYPLSSRSLLFTRTRLSPLNFDASSKKAKYLAFDLVSKKLVLKSADFDDDVREQLVSPEVTNIDNTVSMLKLKFWSSSGMCLSRGSNTENFSSGIPNDTHTLDTIVNHFQGSSPSCLTLDVSDCSNDDVLLFDNFLDNVFGEPINLSWHADKDSGCIRMRRNFAQDVIYISNGDISVPVKVNCTSSIHEERCESSKSYSPSNSSIPSASSSPTISLGPSTVSSTSLSPTEFSQCQVVEGTVCRNLPNGTVDFFVTEVTYEECKSSTTDCDVNKCTTTITTNRTECWYVQKEVKDLLIEIYDFCEDQYPKSLNDGIEFFSSSYSGIGCTFDDSSALFPSQEFTFASDAVILQNDGSGQCLSSLLTATRCSADISQWVYLFSSGHIYYTDNGDMMCLSLDTMGTKVEIRACNSRDHSQAWLYDSDTGTIKSAFNKELCLIDFNSSDKGIGSCNSKYAKWSQYEECSLNTRTTTKNLQLESMNDSGQCLSLDTNELATLAPCSNGSNEWIYNYDGNNATLILADNTSSCLGRRLDDGRYDNTCDSSNVCKNPEDFPSGLVPCKEVVWSRQALAGEENNVFQWSLINFTNGEKLGPDYCLKAPTDPTQTLCDDTMSVDHAQTWRAYGSAGDATEISVKPSATLQIVTDPEVLFQFYLFSKEGKSSRILRSRMAGLIRDVERFKKFLEATLVIVLEAAVIVDLIQEPIGKVDDRMKTGERTFEAFKWILTPLELIPKVGKAVKASRLKPITGMVAKHMKKGQNAMDKIDETVQKLYIPIDAFSEILQRIMETLPIVYAFERFVDVITRSSFCALREGKQEYYDLTQVIINLLIARVNISTNFIVDLKNPLSFMNSFKADISKYIKVPIRQIDRLLDPLFKVAEALKFLEVIASFRIPIPHVKIKFGWKCKVFICWPTFSVKYAPIYFSLEQVGRVVKKIVDAIKSIPIIGQIVSFVEGAVEAALAAIFKFIGVDLPSWNIGLPFVNRITRLAEEAAEKAEEFIEYFEEIMNFDELLSPFTDLLEPLFEAFANAIPSIDLNCDESSTPIQCIFAALGGIKIDNLLDLDVGEVPQFSYDGLDLSSPLQDLADIATDIVDDAESMYENLQNLFTDGVECTQYETVPIDMLSQVETDLLGGSFLPLPVCPVNIDICTSFKFPKVEEFTSFVRSKVDTIIQTRNLKSFARDAEEDRFLSSAGSPSISRKLPGCNMTFPNSTALWSYGVGLTFPLTNIPRDIPWTDITLFPMYRDTALERLLFPFTRTRRTSNEHRLWGSFSGISPQSIFDVSMYMGCDNGDFQVLFKTSPVLSLSAGWRNKKGMGIDWRKFLPNPDFNPTKFARKALTYLDQEKPDMEKFQREVRLVKELSKILCHMDYLFVQDEVSEYIEYIENTFLDIFYRPPQEMARFNELLRKYKKDHQRRYSSPTSVIRALTDGATDVSSTKQIFEQTLNDWSMIEKLLARLQKDAFKRRMKVISGMTLEQRDAFSKVFPPDTFKKRKTCTDFYGYNVGPPYAGTTWRKFTKTILKSFEFSLTSFGALGPSQFPFSSKVRTLDTYGVDERSESFSITPEAISLLLNKGALGLYSRSELRALELEWRDAKKGGNATIIKEKREAYDKRLIEVFIQFIPAINPSGYYDNWKNFQDRTSRSSFVPDNIQARNSIFDWINTNNDDKDDDDDDDDDVIIIIINPNNTNTVASSIFAEQSLTEIKLFKSVSISIDVYASQESEARNKYCPHPSICIVYTNI
eukprot:CAMPEP_0176494246 /NCGR_PEP_ID=MMETSP0200_2-20121128/9982_1 /TAXON_ID=947934 /ORGANISM="Chaetoceros sp., Strain GSL56" /LENGTH=4859 /DNA_ID=CAMNT_0017891967 /DNA_START=343 /DNA_END=14922 /DNA_ORIENTATION=+